MCAPSAICPNIKERPLPTAVDIVPVLATSLVSAMPAAAPTPDVPVLKDKRPRETVDDELVPLLIFDKSDGVVTIILGLSNSKYLASPSAIVIKLVADSVPTPEEVGRVIKLLSTVSLAGSDGYGAP